MIDRIKTLLKSKVFMRYAAIGATGVLLDLLSYALLVKAGVPPVMATILSTSVGITNNFLLNYFLNFKSRSRMLVRFIKFYGVGLVGIITTAAFVFVLHDLMGLGPYVSKAITIPPVVIAQFLLNKHISFSDRSIRRFLRALLARFQK